MPGAVEKTIGELGHFFEPLGNALESGEDFGRFIRNFGIDIDGVALQAALQNLGPLRDGIFDLIDLSISLIDNGFQFSDVSDVKSAAQPVFSNVKVLGQPFTGTIPPGVSAQQWAATLDSLPAEVLSYLLAIYLSHHSPLSLQLLSLIDVYVPETIPDQGHPDSRGLNYRRENFNWNRLRQLLVEPDKWALEAYGWGGDFQTDKALINLIETIEFLGGTADVDHMSDAQVAAFMSHLAGSPLPPMVAKVPIWAESDIVGGVVDADSHAEIGLMVMPAVNPALTESGLGFGPYSEGVVGANVNLRDGVDLSIEGSFGAAGGAIFRALPSELSIERGVEALALSSSFGAELLVTDPAGGKLTLIGNSDSSRVDIDAAVAKLGGEVSTNGFDFYLAAGLRSLRVVIDPGEDGLLSAVISDEIIIDAGDVLIGYRYNSGIYFEGGTSLGISVPLDLSLGPINIYELGVELNWTENLAVSITITADVSIGPLFAYAEGIGLSTSIVPQENGLLGDHDLDFGFVPPTGYAISLDADPITGGGLLSVQEYEYRGALALSFTSIGFSAFAILNTKLPDGKDGFSFAGSIFAEFTVPLGFGFFLTGVGGFIGINRTINTDAMRNVLYSGNFDNLLFPSNPIQNAARILDDMAAILPPRKGQHLIGPVAKISWGQPKLIDIKLGVILEFGADVRVLILGGVAINLPTKEAALVALNLSFFGEIDFGTETLSFDATLEGSRVLIYTISGDIAVRSGWAPRMEHVASFGGLHPQFPKPANLPDLRRLTIAFGTNNPRVSLQAYTAITNSSLQFGARADIYFRGPKIWFVGRLAAEGWIYFNALIYFDPFSFDADLGGGIRLLVKGKTKAELGFSIRLRGPNTFHLKGKVWVSVLGIDVDFGVNHTWGSRKTITIDTIDAVAILRQALEKSGGLEAVSPAGRIHGVSFADSEETLIDPFGGVQLTQRALPLDVAIEKIGEAQVPSSANKLDIKVKRRNGQVIQVSDVDQDFVRGHFFELNETERLSATAFDRHKSGFGFDAKDLIGPSNDAKTADYGYEYIEIPVEEDSNVSTVITGVKALETLFAEKFLGRQARNIAERAKFIKPSFKGDRPLTVSHSVFVDSTNSTSVALVDVSVNRPNSVQDELLALGVAEKTVTTATAIERANTLAPDIQKDPNAIVVDYVALAATI